MIGAIGGVVLALSIAAQSRPDAPTPNCDRKPYTVEFGGNPANAATIYGCVGPDGVLTWWPDDQRFSVKPTDDNRFRANLWLPVKINDRFVNLWGWRDRVGVGGWRLADQRSKLATPDSGSPGTGFVFGVDTSRLKPGQVVASDPGERIKVEAIMDSSAPGGPNCPQPKEPARVPSPTVPSAMRPDWMLIGLVAIGAIVAFGIVCLAILGLAIARWRRS